MGNVCYYLSRMIQQRKRRRLEAKGWKVGSVAELLDLSPAESVYVELKLHLSDALRERRNAART